MWDKALRLVVYAGGLLVLGLAGGALAADVIFKDQFKIPQIKDCPDCPEMIIVPAGSFIMGSPDDEVERRANEGPQRLVAIERFALGKTSVTVEQWNRCAADGGCPFSIESSSQERSQHPATNISWLDAQQYVQWLSVKTGLHYRLPSEAEYEYATRAGTTTRFYTGDCITTDDANFFGPDPAKGCPVGDYIVDTTPVKSYPPNPWGLYDMVGNTQDWVEDCWNENYIDAPSDGKAWVDGQCHLAALKGGAWHIEGRFLRSANRNNDPKDRRFYAVGFRVARSLDQGAFRDCPECPTMVSIPAGSFIQGSPADEPQSRPEERPLRQVNVPEFAIGQTAVTFAQWDACVADGGCTSSPVDNEWGRGNQPVIFVNWHDAQEYVAWLTNKTGYEYRLPSESEWEYAARAGSQGRFSDGDCITTDHANFDGEAPPDGCTPGIYRGRTLAVGTFPANPFGLYDAHGNVWEWVQDCWREDYEGAPTDGSAWAAGDCDMAVLRGGSWADGGAWARSAARSRYGLSGTWNAVGFRVARALHGSSTNYVVTASVSMGEGFITPQAQVVPEGGTARFKVSAVGDGWSVSSVTGDSCKPIDLGGGVWKAVDIRARCTVSASFEFSSEFSDCSDCPQMVVIPIGTFLMGSPPSEPQREHNEGPQREVTVGSFALGKYPVTFAEWDACVADGGCTHSPDDRQWGRGQQPVMNINWYDAQEYVDWLSNVTGQQYRLPSEAEWEYAVRSGTTGRFNTGDCITTEQANFRGIESPGYPGPASGCPEGVFRERPTPVGAFSPNEFGLHDMHGNVREWVEDCWNSDYSGAPSDGQAWKEGDCSHAVRRGGSRFFGGVYARSAARHPDPKEVRNTDFGFRVARNIEASGFQD